MPKLKSFANKTIISRYQLDMFVRCPLCFWLLKKHNVKQPAGFPLTLNIIMDTLLKADFDWYRAQDQTHPILEEFGVPAKLFPDQEKLREWRNNRKGIRWQEPKSGYTLYGAVDEVLIFKDDALAVLDYKSTGAREVKVYPSYQLQMDVYSFLLEQNGYKTHGLAYFAFYQAERGERFTGSLPFRATLLEIKTDSSYIPKLFAKAIRVAESDEAPRSEAGCDLCRWFKESRGIVRDGEVILRDV